MYFQLRKDAEKWFASIADGFANAPKWDMYYLCLMAGFAAGTPMAFEPGMTGDLVDYYPGEYKTRGRLLVGLLLTTDLAERGIALKERDSVYRRIAKLVQSDSPSYLSDEGVKLMNQYANRGYEVLREQWEGERPQTIEGFLRRYYQFIKTLTV